MEKCEYRRISRAKEKRSNNFEYKRNDLTIFATRVNRRGKRGWWKSVEQLGKIILREWARFKNVQSRFEENTRHYELTGIRVILWGLFSLGIFVEYQKRSIDEQQCSCLVGRLFHFPEGGIWFKRIKRLAIRIYIYIKGAAGFYGE